MFLQLSLLQDTFFIFYNSQTCWKANCLRPQGVNLNASMVVLFVQPEIFIQAETGYKHGKINVVSVDEFPYFNP